MIVADNDGWEPIHPAAADDGWEPIAKPQGAVLRGPMAMDSFRGVPNSPTENALGNLIAGGEDVAASAASRYTPAGLIPAGAGLLSALGTAGNEGDKMAGMPLPLPLNVALGLSNNAAAGKAGQAFKSAAAQLQFEPSTDAGKLVAAPADAVFGAIGNLGDKAQSGVEQYTGSKGLGMMANTATQIIPMLLGERVARGGIDVARAAKQADLSRGDANLGDSMAGDLSGFDRQAPTPDQFKAAQSTTADSPPPTGADQLKTVIDGVNAAIKASVQPPPVPTPVSPAAPPVQEGQAASIPPPPPAVAAKLQEVTGGDPDKMAAIIQQAAGDKLAPGETPENLTAAVQGVTNEPANAPEVRGSVGGDRTGVDRAPEPPASPVVSPPVAPAAVEAAAPAAPPEAVGSVGTHIEPGEAPKPATPAEIASSAATAAAKVDMKKARDSLLSQIDEAHAKSPQDAASINKLEGGKWDVTFKDGSEPIEFRRFNDGTFGPSSQYSKRGGSSTLVQAIHEARTGLDGSRGENETVTIDVPGDGKFKVLNTQERLAAFRDQVQKQFKVPQLKQSTATTKQYESRSLNLTDEQRKEILGHAEEYTPDPPATKPVEVGAIATPDNAIATQFDPARDYGGYAKETQPVPQIKDFEQYASERNAGRHDIGEAALHKSNSRVSGRARKAAIETQSARDGAVLANRDELRKEYDAAVGRGEIRPPTRSERLERAAAGHPDNESTKAARRLLGKDVTPFQPAERHQQLLDQHLQRLGNITPEQKQAVIEHHGDVDLDPVLGVPTRKELVPSLEAARSSGEPAAYGEIDIGNVGGLNAHVGSNSGADPHLKAVTDIVQKHLNNAAEASGGQAVLVRKGGDELGAITKGMDADTLHQALSSARDEVAQYAHDNGLESYPNPKKITPEFPEGKPEGLGLQFGVAENTKARNIGETIKEADQLVEKRKKGAPYEQRGQNESAGPGAPVEPARSGAAGSTGTGAREVSSGSRTGEGQTAPAAETGTETTVAEPPVKAQAKPEQPPPTKPVETATETPQNEPQGTQVRNAAVDAQRDRLGLSELPPAEREHWQDASDKAAAGIAKGDIQPRALAAEVSAKPRALTTTETMALAHDLKSLSEEHASATSDALAARDRGDTIGQTQALLRQSAAVDAMETNHAALRNGGTEAARSLSVRNAILKDDYTVGRNMDRARLAFGDKFNDALKKQVEDLSAQLKAEQDRSAKIEANVTANRAAAKSRTDAEKMTPDEKMQARVQKQMDALQKTIADRVKVCPI